MTNTLSCTIINLDLAMSPVIEFYSDKPRTVSSKNLPQAYFYDPSVVISNQQTHFSTNLAANLYEPTPDFFLSMYSTRNATNMFPNQFRYVSKNSKHIFEPVIFEPPILLGNFKKLKTMKLKQYVIMNTKKKKWLMVKNQSLRLQTKVKSYTC